MAMAVVFSAATSYGLFMDVIVNIVVNTSQCLSKLRHSDVIILSRKYFFKMLPNISVLEWLGEGGFPKLPPPSSNSLSCHHLGFMRQTILRGGGGGGGGEPRSGRKTKDLAPCSLVQVLGLWRQATPTRYGHWLDWYGYWLDWYGYWARLK